METFFRIEGAEPGATSVILVGVHGDEKFGVEAMKSLLPIEIQRGRLIVMVGNPRAVEADTRFIDFDLNRSFYFEPRGYEAERMQEIKKVLDEADVLLDIHGSFVPSTQAFAICEPNGYAIVRQLPVSRVVSGFDTFQPGGTDYYMNKRGAVGICVECGYLKDPKATELARNIISAFLVAQKHIDGEMLEYKQEYGSLEGMYITKTDFSLAREYADFETISAGDIVGHDGANPIEAPIDGFILFPKERNGSGQEGFVYGKAVARK